MKKISFYFVFMLCMMSLGFIACGGDDDASSNNPQVPDKPQDSGDSFVSLKGLQVSDLKVDASQHSTSVNISSSSLTGCQVTLTANWCVAEISDSKVNLKIQENTSDEERTVTITLTQPKDNSSLSFNVIQAKNSVIQLDKDNYEISEDGGTITIDVKSNVDYTVDLSSYDWITLGGTRALQSSTIQLVVAVNNTGKSREAVITIKDIDNQVSRNITIKQLFTPQIITDMSTYTVSEDGGNVSIEVKSNVDYTVDLSGYDWITLNGTRALQSSTIQLTVEANNTGNNREAVVKIKSIDNSITANVTINQSGISLTVSPTSVNIHYDETKQLYATPAASNWSVEDDFIAKVDNNGLVTARHIGSTNVIASKGGATASCKVTVTPKYTAYDTPILAWGSTSAEIKAAETHDDRSSSTSSMLVYNYTFGSNVCLMGYSFEEDKLNGVLAMMQYSATLYSRIGYYLLERYQPIGSKNGDYYFVDAMSPEKITTAVVFGTSGNYITVTYIQYTTSSSSAPSCEKINALKKNLKIKTDKMVTEMIRKYSSQGDWHTMKK